MSDTQVCILTLVRWLSDPCILLLFLIPLNRFMRKKSKENPYSNRRLHNLQIALTILVICLSPWQNVKGEKQDWVTSYNLHQTQYGYPPSTSLSHVFAYLVVLILTVLGKRKSGVPGTSTSLFMFWCARLVTEISALYNQLHEIDNFKSGGDFFMAVLHTGIILAQCVFCFMRSSAKLEAGGRTGEIDPCHHRDETGERVPHLQSDDQNEKRATHPLSDDKTGGRSPHPQTQASWLNDLLLHWTLGLITTGATRGLQETDMCDMLEQDKCRNVSSTLERTWRIEKFTRDLDDEIESRMRGERWKKNKNGTNAKDNEGSSSRNQGVPIRVSLFKVLVKTFGLEFFFLQFIKGIGELTLFVQPVLMGAFMEHIQNRQTEHWTRGMGLVFSIFAFNTANTIFQHRIWATIQRLQKRIRSSMMMCVFNKALTIKNDCTKDITTGEIVNLICDHCDRVMNVSQNMYQIFSTPLMIGMCLYLLHSQVGHSMYIGLVIIVSLVPMNKFVGEKLKNVSLEINKTREQRGKLINEILNGIKILKLYAWEPSFMAKVQDIRGRENECNTANSVLNGLTDCMYCAIPYLVKLGAFAAFLSAGGHVNAARGFTTIHLFHILNKPFSLMALLIPGYIEAVVSLKKINKFLNGEDIPHDIVVRRRKGESAITIDNGNFSWSRDASIKSTLRDINVNIPKGSLVAVVGMVGCGKSSLLSAVLGEMEKEDGHVEVQGRAAYVPQEAWTLNATLRDNVVFGSPLDFPRYKKVVNACSMRTDIQLMAAGDQTEIGEKGINLSGGQKQRVSLARAVYNDADVYLLDDPLSAVDAHVGKHIFNHVIGHRGLLKGKTRVLVTHGIHWLPYVDSIIFIKDGTIAETGTYKQLTSVDGALTGFLRDVLSHKTNESVDKVHKVRERILHRLNSITRDKEGETPVGNVSIQRQTPGCSREDTSESKASLSSNDSSDNDDNWDSLQETEIPGEGGTPGSFMDDEVQVHGRVDSGIYLEYIRAVGYRMVTLLFLTCLTTCVAGVLNTGVLQKWTDDPYLANRSLKLTAQYGHTNWAYFKHFAVTGAMEVAFSFFYVALVLKGTFHAATRLHNTLLYKVLRSPISFFNTTPSSRIFIRLTKYVIRVDGLGGILQRLIQQCLNMATFLTLIVLYCPMVGLYLVPLSFGYLILSRLHVGTMRQIRRYKSKYRSPVYQHFSETLHGKTSIRAFKTQLSAIKTMEKRIDQFNNFVLWEVWVSVGYSMRTKLLCHLVGLATGMVSVLNSAVTAGTVGMVTMYAEQFSDSLGEFLRLLSHAETELVSLEKVVEYTKKASEAEWEREDKKLDIGWPHDGRIVFDNYQTRYREGQDLILKGINCRIEGGQKVGIVGRTGAGKSTLTQAFFRLLEAADGNIVLDDENIAHLGLHDLRSRINILPQEPVVFSGSLRMNLDPFGRNTDEELWKALRLSHLAPFVEDLPEQLDHECGEGGKNMSVGQRQLLCLARTLLRMSKVLVLDEATAAVDMETDELIQKTIRTEFKDCTVLSIAHRLNTVMDYDKIMVLDSGLVKEFDSPANLLADRTSTFYSMAKESNLVDT